MITTKFIPEWNTLASIYRQSTVHGHFTYMQRVKGCKVQDTELYKDFRILKKCIYVYYHEEIYIYIYT